MDNAVIGDTRQFVDVCASARAVQDILFCVSYYPGMPDMSIAHQTAVATLEVNIRL